MARQPQPIAVVDDGRMTAGQAVDRIEKLRDRVIPYYEQKVEEGRRGEHDPAPYQAKLTGFRQEFDALSHFVGRKLKG